MNSASVPGASTSSEALARPVGRRVVDAPTRVFHWLFAICFAGAYASGDTESWRALHVVLGYTMGGLLMWRIAYGFWGPAPVRWSSWLSRMAGAVRWLKSCTTGMARGRVNWQQAYTALMTVLLLAALLVVAPLTLSGYMLFSELAPDRLTDALEGIHEMLGQVMLAAVLGHVALLLASAVLRRHNPAAAMLWGRSAGRGPDLIRHNRGALALLMLAAVTAYWSWEWSQSPRGLIPVHSVAGGNGGDHDERVRAASGDD